MMCTLALLSACLLGSSVGRRVLSSEQVQSSSQQGSDDALQSLASLLWATNPALAWQVPAAASTIATTPRSAVAPFRTPSPQMKVDFALVKKLNEQMGGGMQACKSALKEADNDYEKAKEIMRLKGIAKAEKVGGRTAAEGLIGMYVHPGSKLAVMVEVNCETDFVAKTDAFTGLVKDLSVQIAMQGKVEYVDESAVTPEMRAKEREIQMANPDLEGKPDDIKEKIVEARIQKDIDERSLMKAPNLGDPDGKETIDDMIKAVILKVGENIKVARFAKYQVGR